MNEGISSNGFERITAHIEDHSLLAMIQVFMGRGLHINGSDFEETMQCMCYACNGIDNNVTTSTNTEYAIITKHKLIRVQEIDKWMSHYHQQIREEDSHAASCYLGCIIMAMNFRKK